MRNLAQLWGSHEYRWISLFRVQLCKVDAWDSGGLSLSFSCTLSHLFCMLGLPSSLRKRIMRSFSPIKRYARGLVNFLPWWPACPGLLILRPFCVPSGNAKGLGGRSIITVKPRNYCCFPLSLKFLRAPLLEFKFFVHGHINLCRILTCHNEYAKKWKNSAIVY